ncbi:MAG: O-antigen ligase family protein [Prochlorococcaceae cyanobacterium]
MVELRPVLRRIGFALRAERPEAAAPVGWICFQLGLLLLASSALLAALLLLVAVVLGCRRRPSVWRDPVNWLLLLVALLMMLGCFNAYSGWLAWVGLGNWLPFFWGFWGFQVYLTTPAARRRAGLWLLAGTVPVVVTGLGQMLLGWSGPFEALGGAIIWHLDAGGKPEGRLSGLFDYANITGTWLALAVPFALAALLQPQRCWPRRLTALLLLAATLAALYGTDSRNAWGAAVLALPLVIGPASRLWLLPLLLLALLPVALASLPSIPSFLQDPARALVPEGIWERLSDSKYGGRRRMASTRLGQWTVAIGLIAERPWLGWGAAAFSVIYPLRTGLWHGHTHNLPLDLAISHGWPVALLLVALVLGLLIRAARLGMAAGSPHNPEASFERAWWAAALVLVLLHATDIPMYDSRINVAGWVLLAGLRAVGSAQPQRPTGATSPVPEEGSAP